MKKLLVVLAVIFSFNVTTLFCQDEDGSASIIVFGAVTSGDVLSGYGGNPYDPSRLKISVRNKRDLGYGIAVSGRGIEFGDGFLLGSRMSLRRFTAHLDDGSTASSTKLSVNVLLGGYVEHEHVFRDKWRIYFGNPGMSYEYQTKTFHLGFLPGIVQYLPEEYIVFEAGVQFDFTLKDYEKTEAKNVYDTNVCFWVGAGINF